MNKGKNFPKIFNKNIIDRACLISSQFAANVQLLLGKKDYYVEVANGRRGTVPDTNGQEKIKNYDIASCPDDDSVETIKKAYLAIMREKAINDMYVFEALTKQLVKDSMAEKEETLNEHDLISELLCSTMSLTSYCPDSQNKITTADAKKIRTYIKSALKKLQKDIDKQADNLRKTKKVKK